METFQQNSQQATACFNVDRLRRIQGIKSSYVLCKAPGEYQLNVAGGNIYHKNSKVSKAVSLFNFFRPIQPRARPPKECQF